MKLTANKKKKHITTFFFSQSKKFKFYYKPRKFLKLNMKNIFILKYFCYGLINLKAIYLNLEPLLACLKLIKRFLKFFFLNKTSLHILIFPDFYLTNKPKEVRMGRGKGQMGRKVVLLKKNTLLFLLGPIHFFYAKYILTQCKIRLPVSSKIIYKYW